MLWGVGDGRGVVRLGLQFAVSFGQILLRWASAILILSAGESPVTRKRSSSLQRSRGDIGASLLKCAVVEEP